MKEQPIKHDPLKGFLEEQFKDFEDRPDRDVWDAIETELAESPDKRKAWMPYLMIAASVALLLSMILLLRAPQGDKTLVQDKPAPISTPDSSVRPQVAQQPTDEQAIDSFQAPIQPLKGAPRRSISEQASPDPAANQGQPEALEPANRVLEEKDDYEYMAEVTPVEATPQTNQIENIDPQEAENNIQGSSPLSGLPIEPGIPIQNNTSRTQRISGKRNSLDLNELTLSDAVQFASNELEKFASSPIKVHQEDKGGGEVKTYQFSFLDLKITTKSHRKRSK